MKRKSPPASSAAPSGDFASAAMLRVLRQGLLDLGLPPGAADPRGAEGRATVPLDDKRRLLAHALAVGGPACLALLGRGVHRFRHEPTHRALTSARDAADLFERWGRLERYIHSRHRVRLLRLEAGQARLHHVSLSPQTSSPQPAESLVVAGLLAALLEACGHRGVRCEINDAVQVYPRVDDGAALARAMAVGATADWCLRWSGHTAPETEPAPATAAPAGLAEGESWAGWVRQVFDQLAARLPSPPGMDELALSLGLSRRSAQRELQRQGTAFRTLLAEARFRSAGWWLLRSAAPLAEIGFLCGYADQSHFAREFRRRSGLPPVDYRRHFAVAPR
ncbi:helix-turn-helix transcriptional regulator [Roseateles sp. DAIF2]|uniref:helix-turn-helix transcriptional regulator n=1 Tax=Roseateles sp. DAIF2 TaxID=2714952 RepID=UPI0018A2730A|nr:AraC family transcriptional regulator [Roseateles sp. DAIF2]QPF71703.1 helix-turn-helix transcriptional regulator [Roseateles sp. DAIF2]